MNLELLRQFLIDSNKAGYAGGNNKQWIKEQDGSTTIPFEKGDYRSNDNFFGGEPYGGRVIVFHKNKPVWMMVYYGWVLEGENPQPIYKILQNGLMRMPEDAPFRGPKEYIEGEYVYTNSWDGNIDRYYGEEIINQNDKLVYKANYFGGLVDQK